MNLTFQRKTDLALRALRSLEAPEVKMSGPTLSSAIGTTTSFLPHVMAPLIDMGWVRSERGPGGGYSLTEAASGLSLLDVIEATEGPAVTGRCILRDAPCPGDEACAVHVIWSEGRDALIDGLRSIPAVQTQGAEQ